MTPPPFPLPRPRPRRWRPAGPPRWAGTDPSALDWASVAARLGAPGGLDPPGAHGATAGGAAAADGPEPDVEADPLGLDPASRRPAAVLVALWPDDAGATRVLLTKRPAHLPSHAGEVSFPGGAVEDGEGPEAAAVREAREEVGLDGEGLVVVGALPALPTVGSRYVITPVVATLPGRPRLRPHLGEVERILTPALAALVAPAALHAEEWEIGGHWRPVLFVRTGGDVVWGATARILDDLLRRLLR